jgi:hypothetical protein
MNRHEIREMQIAAAWGTTMSKMLEVSSGNFDLSISCANEVADKIREHPSMLDRQELFDSESCCPCTTTPS